MIIFLYLSIIAALKAIADTIKVPEKFATSIFRKYSGNQWVDPSISWINQHHINIFLYPILVHFSDLWHLCQSLIIGGWLLIVLSYPTNYFTANDIVMFFTFYLWFGTVFEVVYKIINKNK